MQRQHNSNFMTVTAMPDQYDLEREIKEIVDTQNMSRAARMVGKDQTAVSKMFSPAETDRHNPVTQVLKFIWAFDQFDTSTGDRLLSLLSRVRNMWLPTMKRQASTAEQTKQIGDKLMSAMVMELDPNASATDKVAAYTEVSDAVKARLDALAIQYQSENQTEIPVSRLLAKHAVAQRSVKFTSLKVIG